jgi:hypothetical protein
MQDFNKEVDKIINPTLLFMAAPFPGAAFNVRQTSVCRRFGRLVHSARPQQTEFVGHFPHNNKVGLSKARTAYYSKPMSQDYTARPCFF